MHDATVEDLIECGDERAVCVQRLSPRGRAPRITICRFGDVLIVKSDLRSRISMFYQISSSPKGCQLLSYFKFGLFTALILHINNKVKTVAH